MKYSTLAFLIAWMFPTKEDRKQFRTFCNEIDSRKDSEMIQKSYIKIIKRLQAEIQSRKLNVIFLSSENAKWAYQSIYEEFSKNPKFNTKVLVYPRKTFQKKKYNFLEYKDLAEKNYNHFKQNGINVEYSFNFKTQKYINLKRFNPDIIFYEQPWDLPEEYSIKHTAKYALTFYCAYGSCITNGQNEYSETFYRDVLTYFLDNHFIKNVLLEHGCNEKSLVVCGQPKLDYYLNPVNKDNIIWKTNNKKRVIYAPHHSFSKESMLKFGTFDWNYKYFFNFAKAHPEIEFIIKPHPELKRQIVREKLMSVDEMIRYFEMWANLPNAQVYEFGDYFDMFRTSDLLITDCNSFLYEYLPTKKPVIHLIGKYSVGHNNFGQKIISGYYPVRNIDELNSQLDLVLFKEQDPLLSVRTNVIEKDLIQPNNGVARFISNYIIKILGVGHA
ncbi:MAG: CDP-glycerol glycerophosphotransferase family protein [Candidatus Gastranaerophilaceae bacterium]